MWATSRLSALIEGDWEKYDINKWLTGSYMACCCPFPRYSMNNQADKRSAGGSECYICVW